MPVKQEKWTVHNKQCSAIRIAVLRRAILTLSAGLHSADTSGSCDSCNPSDLALLLTYPGTLLISKFTRIRRYEFSPTISED